MLRAGGNAPTGKAGGRKKKVQQSRKAVDRKVSEPIPEPSQEVEQISAPESLTEGLTDGLEADALMPAPSPTEIPLQPEVVPVNLQTIANAYRDYTTKSLERGWSFFEKLASARSPEKAFELQAEFAKQAYESLVANSQNMLELYNEMAKQRVVYLEGFVIRVTQTTLIPLVMRN